MEQFITILVALHASPQEGFLPLLHRGDIRHCLGPGWVRMHPDRVCVGVVLDVCMCAFTVRVADERWSLAAMFVLMSFGSCHPMDDTVFLSDQSSPFTKQSHYLGTDQGVMEHSTIGQLREILNDMLM